VPNKASIAHGGKTTAHTTFIDLSTFINAVTISERGKQMYSDHRGTPTPEEPLALPQQTFVQKAFRIMKHVPPLAAAGTVFISLYGKNGGIIEVFGPFAGWAAVYGLYFFIARMAKRHGAESWKFTVK